VLPGDQFGMHLPNGLAIRGAELFLPRGVPYVGGTVVPVELVLGVPSGVDARTEVDVPAEDGRPHLHGVIEWHDPAALSLAECVPTLVDLSAEFDLDGTTTPPAGPVGGVVLAAGKPLPLRARYARDTRISPARQQFDVTVQGEGPDGLLRVAVDDGLAGNVAARVFVTGAALAGSLLADTPASTAPSGDPTSAGLAALLGVASVLSSFCQKGKVVVHGVTVIGMAGPGSPKLALEVDYSVDILVKTITFGGLSIGMQDDVPMRVRYRQVRLEIDPAASGLEQFHLSYDQASMDVEDPGRWRVPRTDLLPGPSSFPPTAIAALWAALSADAKDKQIAVDQRLLELDVLSGANCPVPHLGATLGGNAGLVPGATYDLAVHVPKKGQTVGIPLPGMVFSTSRYHNPREQVADLGFSTAFDGGLPVPELPGLAGLPAGERDSAAALGVLLDALGLGLWAPPVDRGRATLLWSRPDPGAWRLTGVLLENPEPLERVCRMRLGALDCLGVPFDVVRRNGSGTRVLYLTRRPVIPRRRRVGPGLVLPPYLTLTVLEHPATTSPVTPTTPPQTSFTVRAVAPTVPAFAEELS
jgi:hypothetical protein